jgi:NuA3 HAT complex component NTO1
VRRAIRRLPCRCCRQHGACIQCAHSNCFTAFHPLCARAHGLTVTVLDDEVDDVTYLLRAFCPAHKRAWLESGAGRFPLPADSHLRPWCPAAFRGQFACVCAMPCLFQATRSVPH